MKNTYSARFIVISLFLIFTACIISCGRSIFGPAEPDARNVSEDDIEITLQRAEDIYLNANNDKGNQASRLAMSQSIYSGLIDHRWEEMSDTQRIRAVRGYCQVSTDMLISDPQGLINSTIAVFTSFDTTCFKFTNTTAQKSFLTYASNIRNEFVTNFLTTKMLYKTKLSSRTEADFVLISMYNAIAIGFDVAEVLISPPFDTAHVTNVLTKADEFNSNYNAFIANRDISRFTALSNSCVSTALAVKAAYDAFLTGRNAFKNFTSDIVNRSSTMFYHTAPAKNAVTIQLNNAMNTALKEIDTLFAVFDQLEITKNTSSPLNLFL